MQKTLKEVRNLLKQKVENVKIDLEKSQLSNLVFPCIEKIFKLQGEIEAYEDAITLIETSHLLEEEDESKKDNN